MRSRSSRNKFSVAWAASNALIARLHAVGNLLPITLADGPLPVADKLLPDIDWQLLSASTKNESGIEIARKIQDRLPYSLSVILLTGDTAPERLQEAMASGYQLLHKPVDLPRLRSIMQDLLNKNNQKNGTGKDEN